MQTQSTSIQQLLMQLWRHISSRRRKQFSWLLILMVCASFAEAFSIGAVLPFLGVLTAPEQVFEHAIAQPFIQLLGLTESRQLLLPLTIAFGTAAILAGAMRLLLLWVSTRLSFATGADLSISIYRRTLYQSYAVHCARNSSEVITGISTKANQVIYSTIVPVLTLISSSIMLTVILFALLAVEPMIALIIFGGFGLLYALIIRLTRKRLLAGSQRIAYESTQVIKALQEGLGGIRDVLIDSSQAAYCQIYRNADLPLRRAQGNNYFISASPRFGMEALGMLLIAILAYSLAQQADGIAKAIPILGALALGAQRLLPVLQQAYGAWSQIRGGQASLQDALALLDQPLPAHAEQTASQTLPFQHQIQLRQLAFRYYAETPWILRNINLTIQKGSRVGFMGATGSGKSTLTDIIMGLLSPTEGTLMIDDRAITQNNQNAWQQHIAHVPQNIFLADSTVAENIAFGIPAEQIDHARVRQAAQQAQIAENIESWPAQYQTFVGERGICLSGGQRQRIGIARALYKQADVIVFDEATSALDNDTERMVMESIHSIDKNYTVLIVAHRISTLKECDYIIKLKNIKAKKISNFDAL